MTTVTLWVDGQDYEVSADQVIPWICGVYGVLDTVDIGSGSTTITVDVDPAASDRPGTMYTIEIDGVRHDLAEPWVLPWMRGLAVRNNIKDQMFDPRAAERAQRIQALMVGHQLGLFNYTGFTHKEAQ